MYCVTGIMPQPPAWLAGRLVSPIPLVNLNDKLGCGEPRELLIWDEKHVTTDRFCRADD